MLRPWAEDMLDFLAHFFIVVLTIGFVLLAVILVVILIKWFIEWIADKLY